MSEDAPSPPTGGMSDFPAAPRAWYHFCSARDLRDGPRSMVVGGRTIVVFRGPDGRPAALHARCCHLGADLGHGETSGGLIRCGLHGWEFGVDGVCVRIPTGCAVPRFARQAVYPVAERAGHIFVFNRPMAAGGQAEYPMPFFDGVAPDDLVGAPEYALGVDAHWALVSANAFDVQHFRCAHERTLVGDVRVDDVGPHARRITAEFGVTGKTWRDGLTRFASGDRLTMSITAWGGVLMFVHARFRSTTTYGLLSLLPQGPDRTDAVNIIFVQRHRGVRALLDPLDVRIRRSFIRHFLTADLRLLSGLRYSPGTLVDDDHDMRGYLDWLRGRFRGDDTATTPATPAGEACGITHVAPPTSQEASPPVSLTPCTPPSHSGPAGCGSSAAAGVTMSAPSPRDASEEPCPESNSQARRSSASSSR